MKMKKLMALFLSLCLAVTGIAISPKKVQAITTTYTLGKTVSGETTKSSYIPPYYVYSSDTYTFNVNKDSDVIVKFTAGTDDSLKWTLEGTTNNSRYYESISAGTTYTRPVYLTQGTYTFKVSNGAAKYSFCISNSNNYKVKFAKSSGKIDGALKKTVGFTYSCSYTYASKYLTIKNSKKKVAECTYQLYSDGTGVITLDPKRVGKTKITLKLAGGNSAKYVGIVNSSLVFMAKGSTRKMTKPVGVKKLKWKTKKAKVATVDKNGKVKAKGDGRARIIGKKGKETYTYNVIVTDYTKLGKKLYREIKEDVRNPESLKIYNVYYGYSKTIVDGAKVPVIFVDYGATNAYGAMDRSKKIAYYDDVHEMHSRTVYSYADIMNRKRMNAKKIK